MRFMHQAHTCTHSVSFLSSVRAVRQWGKSKQQYYNADATDLEIGQVRAKMRLWQDRKVAVSRAHIIPIYVQDFADAEEEEEAAREVEQARYDDMDEDDYGINDEEEEEEDDDDAAGAMGALLKGKGKGKDNKGLSSSRQTGDDSIEETKISRNLSKLSRTGKLQVLMTDSPELLTLLEEFKEKLGELKERVEPLLPLARKVSRSGERG